MIHVNLISIGECTAIGIRLDVTKAPILIIRGKKGMLTCGYFRIGVADFLGDAMAVVTDVNDFNDMLSSKVVAVSKKARELGVKVGDSGKDALLKMC